MDKITNNLKITDICSATQLKKKFKSHLNELGYNDLKVSKTPYLLIQCLIIILEDFLTNSIEHIEKNETNGLYLLKSKYLQLVFDNYNFVNKYIKKYNKNIKYGNSIYFNINKVYTNLESKFGNKLMIENEAKNIINYILLSLQFDLIRLSASYLTFSGKKTMTGNLLSESVNYLIDNEELLKKITLKMDSHDICTEIDLNDANEVDDIEQVIQEELEA
jgi:hypothetical protein